ncbi:hypothetical protein L1D14_07445 [Vibrio tubiashii]|uniref:hypothetical protein n=1 Tax=Vibrio tubiashii TaxID=29498 RepID=UPI001EFC365C|nr:hypothetical protein [Vibrio tubiashii]MCG9576072.1 hypothetical protein [Vibrio tubiashii]
MTRFYANCGNQYVANPVQRVWTDLYNSELPLDGPVPFEETAGTKTAAIIEGYIECSIKSKHTNKSSLVKLKAKQGLISNHGWLIPGLVLSDDELAKLGNELGLSRVDLISFNDHFLYSINEGGELGSFNLDFIDQQENEYIIECNMH